MPSERQLFLKHLAQTTDFPLMLEIENAEGIYMYDHTGKTYIDLISGIGVSNLGHRHPNVLEAIQKQLDRYLHLMVYGEFIQSPQVQLARALSDTLPESISSCYFVNSGSEAVEGALKLAKRFTRRTKIISCHNAYHGSTCGALSVSGNEKFKQAYRPLLPMIEHIRHGVHADLEIITEDTAAVLIEVVQGEAGVRTASTDYFKALRQRCTDMGTLLIADEIQSGFGRTGTFWAFAQYPFEPDIVVSAKGMGGGMPIGTFMAGEAIMSVLKNDPILGHITTFGGHPVSASASLATLTTIINENLIGQVAQKSALFHQLLKHPMIREVRSAGLMMAVQFESFEVLKRVIDNALSLGVVTDWFLYCDDSMRIAPPLIITEDQIREACDIIMRAIDLS